MGDRLPVLELELWEPAKEAGASLAGWDLVATRTDWCPTPLPALGAHRG